jgi:threonine dehydratase
MEQLDEMGHGVDTVMVAVGGGGLMSGVAAAVEGTARVVAVEPVTAPTLHEALSAGEPVDVSVSGPAADSLGARRIGSIAWEVARRTQVVSVLVDDEALLEARRRLWDRYRLVLEAGASAPVAALLSGAYRPPDGERVAVVSAAPTPIPPIWPPHPTRPDMPLPRP